MSTVYLPEYLEPMAHRFAEDHVEFVDEIGRNNPNYGRAYDRAFTRFCKDYHEALTGIQSNPSTQQADSAFRAVETGFIPLVLDGRIEKSKANVLIRRFKTSIIHLLHIYLARVNSKKDMKIKRQSNELLDSMYEYQKKSGDKELTKQQMSEANKQRFIRMFLVASLMASIERIFTIDYRRLDRLMEKIFNGQVPTTMTNAELNNNFSRNIFNLIREYDQKSTIPNTKNNLTDVIENNTDKLLKK
jgi:hypothetical protein